MAWPHSNYTFVFSATYFKIHKVFHGIVSNYIIGNIVNIYVNDMNINIVNIHTYKPTYIESIKRNIIYIYLPNMS